MLRLSKLSAFSAYARPEAHLTRQTTHGAVVTIVGLILGIVLTSHEVSWFFSGKGTAKMAVDLARRHDLNIKLDVSFPAIPCAGLSVDILDASGTTESDVSSNSKRDVHLHKERLNAQGQRIRGKDGEYQTPVTQQQTAQGGGTVMSIDIGAAMQQMGDMESEITAHEGCRLHGDVQVRRVAGRLHFAVHQQSFLDILPQMLTGHQLPRLTNMSHVIHKLSFGPEYPGQVNPLDGFSRILPVGSTLQAYRYFLKIVPTNYFTRMGVVLETSQYSVGEYALPVQTSADDHTKGGVRYPYVDVSYDLSPIIMTINQSPASMLHFVVRMCAVIGGVLSVTRMLDLIVDRVFRVAGYTPFTPRTSAAGSDKYTPSVRTSAASELPSMPSYTGGPRNGSFPGTNYSGGGAPGSPMKRYGSGNSVSYTGGGSYTTSQSGLGQPTYRSTSSHPGQSPLAQQGSWQGGPLPQGAFQSSGSGIQSYGSGIQSYGSGSFVAPPTQPSGPK